MIQRLFWRRPQLSFDLNRRCGSRGRTLVTALAASAGTICFASSTELKSPFLGIALHLRKGGSQQIHFFEEEEGESDKLTQKISISSATSYSIFAVPDPASFL